MLAVVFVVVVVVVVCVVSLPINSNNQDTI